MLTLMPLASLRAVLSMLKTALQLGRKSFDGLAINMIDPVIVCREETFTVDLDREGPLSLPPISSIP